MDNRSLEHDQLLTSSTTNVTTPKVYDVIIIGAGINGCACAYKLSQAKQDVLLIDEEAIAAGGSGAAGAFISPKFTKGGALKVLLEEAYRFSLAFYTQNFAQHIQVTKLLQIANSQENATRLKAFKESTTLVFEENTSYADSILSEEAKASESLLLKEGGIVSASAICHALVQGVDFKQQKIETLTQVDGLWQVGEHQAKKVILATGSYDLVIKMPYLELRRVWGHRIDVKSSTKVPHSIHHHLSISPSTSEGIIAIGATHNLHYNPFSDEQYDLEAGRQELLEKALKSVDLQDVVVIKDYVGLRSGSNDYLPIIGAVVDEKATFGDADFKVFNLKRMDDDAFSFHRDLYMINGTGGYGFVLAPYLAEQLCEHILDATKEINQDLTPTRFFRRWAKRQV